MNTYSNQKGASKLIPIIVVVVLLLAGGGYYMMNRSQSADVTNVPTQTTPTPAAQAPVATPPQATTPVAPVATGKFKDGTYTGEGTYTTPEVPEKVTLTLTVKDDVVTDSVVKQVPASPKSEIYQNVFAEGYKSQVVGKKLSDIHVGVVSGSSLTSNGFNLALAEITKQAQR